MLEGNTRKKMGLAKMLLQQGEKQAVQGLTTSQTELFDLKNFRKGLRDTLVGTNTLNRLEKKR
jgi:hypothetical protein